MSKKLTITICSSANFYKKAVKVQTELENLGYKVIVPHTAEKMKKSGNYDAAHYRTWHKDPKYYSRKTWLMRKHFDEVVAGDIILIINDAKHGQPNYIGGNVLMEMALAFHLKKPIYLFNDIPSKSTYLEEIIGMEAVPMHGDLKVITNKHPV
jgi:hypothetical protein